MKFKKTVYLAGCISYFYNTNQPQRATVWRDKAVNFLNDINIKCFNPCEESERCWTYPQGGVLKQNYFYLKNSDIILLNLDMIEDSIGTIWEVSTAWNEHKVVIAFGKTHWLDRPHMQTLIDVHFNALDEALEYIADMYDM